MNPELFIALVIALKEAVEAADAPPFSKDEDIPDVVLLGTYPDGDEIGICATCRLSILAVMEESDKQFRQSKDDKLKEFTGIAKCPNRNDRFHITLR